MPDDGIKFTGKTDEFGNPVIVHPILGECVYYDARTPEDHKAEARGLSGESLGPEVDPLVEELIRIGRSPGFLKPCREDYEGEEKVYTDGRPYPIFSSGEFNEAHHNVRAREIGQRIHEIGGLRLMQSVCVRVTGALSGYDPSQGRCLEFCWADIGEWLP